MGEALERNSNALHRASRRGHVSHDGVECLEFGKRRELWCPEPFCAQKFSKFNKRTRCRALSESCQRHEVVDNGLQGEIT